MMYDSKNNIKNRLKVYWNGWPWEWFLSVSLKDKYYEHVLKGFRIELQKEEKLQVAYVGLYVFYPQPHLHLLMLGQNRFGKRLADVNPKRWEREWGEITKRSAMIQNIYDQEGVISYMVEQNMPNQQHWEVTPYNGNLLKRMKIK